MEVGLYINNLDDFYGAKIESYNYGYGTSDDNGVKAAYTKMISWLSEKGIDTFTYLYFGNEFCEYLIPSIETIQKYFNICHSNKLVPVFVTPVVTDYGITQLRKIFNLLRTAANEMEIVVNDLGVMTVLKNEFPNFNLIAGRMLDKTSHDSRINTSELDLYYGEDGLKYAMAPGILSEMNRQVMSNYGVNNFEFDLPKTGLKIENQCECSLYWPFNYLTTGRVCLFRSINLKGKDKFLVGSNVCSRVCCKLELELRKPISGFHIENGNKISNHYIFQKGNTIFYIYSRDNWRDIALQFQRIVIQLL